MKEIVVISGKGGTGKTSIVASLAALAEHAVLADCDVDAADLHLLLTPKIEQTEDFYGGRCYHIENENCAQCGFCEEVCRFDAVIEHNGYGDNHSFSIDPIACESCGVCYYFCPDSAIVMDKSRTGELFTSRMRYGPMVHARLGIAEENSGKLVALVRKRAREVADRDNAEYIIIDGPPGVGCPVISSITGADVVLIVTEPTISGLSDLKRVAELTGHFGIKTGVCINKSDLNLDVSQQISDYCSESDIAILGRIGYNEEFTGALVRGEIVLEIASEDLAAKINSLWENLNQLTPVN
ncbi:MAG: (4Fe-4S)-binding protein [candidate division Zixibacteria bacterium]|nr:(4Fe-4S)-binding protein [candidate division Zixibacteria bacterium]